jgi:hypothetical protein
MHGLIMTHGGPRRGKRYWRGYPKLKKQFKNFKKIGFVGPASLARGVLGRWLAGWWVGGNFF